VPEASSETPIERETKRLYQRYALELIEAFDLCPYASRARIDERTAERVMTQPNPTDDEVLEWVRALGRDPKVEVAFAIFPCLVIERLALNLWVERLRHTHQAEPGGLIMTMEGFHPTAAPDLTTPGRLVPFLRRTPHPTIQLTRLSALERVRRSAPHGTGFVDLASVDLRAFLAIPIPDSVSERIADNNREKVIEVGVPALQAVLDDIFRDRDETFRRLAADGEI
jgi:hypothetical protein